MWRSVQETRSAILLVTQELGVIANYCDRVLVLHDRRVVEDAPVRTFFAAPQHPCSRDVLRLYRERGGHWPAQVDGPAIMQPDALTMHFPFRYSSKVVHAVDAASLSIAQGEALGLVGESGRQDDGGPLSGAPSETHGRADRVSEPRPARPGQVRAEGGAGQSSDRVPGPVRQPEPALDGAATAGRGVETAHHTRTQPPGATRRPRLWRGSTCRPRCLTARHAVWGPGPCSASTLPAHWSVTPNSRCWTNPPRCWRCGRAMH